MTGPTRNYDPLVLQVLQGWPQSANRVAPWNYNTDPAMRMGHFSDAAGFGTLSRMNGWQGEPLISYPTQGQDAFQALSPFTAPGMGVSHPGLSASGIASPAQIAAITASNAGITSPVPRDTVISCYPDSSRTGTETAHVFEAAVFKKDGTPDRTHGEHVANIYHNALGNASTPIHVTLSNDLDNDGQADTEKPPGLVELPTQYQTREDLDQHIDSVGTQVLSQIAQKINRTESGMVLMPLAWSRALTYLNVVDLLEKEPQLAPHLGLTTEDVKGIDLSDGKNPHIPDQVKEKVVSYVDSRYQPTDSAYKKALGLYQQAVFSAAQERNICIVAAMGNDGGYRDLFPSAGAGMDTNFLACSDDLIAVAAANTNNTETLEDDEITGFSSHGNDRFKPTVAAKGDSVPLYNADGDLRRKCTAHRLQRPLWRRWRRTCGN